MRVCAMVGQHAVAAAILLVLACSQDDDSKTLPLPRDPEIEQSWEVSSDANATIGEDPAAPLGQVSDATLAGNLILVADPQFQRISVFDIDGSFRYTFGRSGGGPGEFSSLSNLSRVPNGVAAWDDVRRRLTLFSLNGVVEGVVEPIPPVPGIYEWEMVGRSGPNLVAFLARPFPTFPEAGIKRTPASAILTIVNTATSETEHTVHIDGPDEWLLRSGPTVLREPTPLKPPILAAATTGGVILVMGDSVILQQPGARASWLVPFPRESVSATAAASYKDSLIENARRGLDVRVKDNRGGWIDGKQLAIEGTKRIADVIEFPDSSSAIDRIIIDTEGLLWMRTRQVVDGLRTWIILDERMKVVARASVPNELHVFDIGPDIIVSSGRGSNGEPVLRVHSLRRSSIQQQP